MAQRQTIGAWCGVTFEVAAWDGVAAEVDLSCGCMFTREIGRDGPAGGLLHLDGALSGALTGLRREGHFRAGPMETMLLNRPPAGIAARAILLIGLGDPEGWTAETSALAAATAARTAIQIGVDSAAFAPSVLDGGLAPGATGDMPGAMLRAVIAVLDSQHRLAELGLASPGSLRRWVFDVGAARFQGAADRFRDALAAAHVPRTPPPGASS